MNATLDGRTVSTRSSAASLFAHHALATAAGLLHAEAGSGPPVVALHGGLGGWDQSAILDLALFGAPIGRRVLAVARPGYPGSTTLGSGDPRAQAERLLRLLDERGVDRAVLAAVSGGGPIALAFAAAHPDRCRGLVLVSACAGALTSPVPLAMRATLALRRVKPLVDWMGRRLRDAPIRDAALRAILAEDPETAELFDALRRTFADDLGRRLGGLADDIAMCAAAHAPRAGEIVAPALFIHAVDDPIVPFALAEIAAARLPRSEILALSDGGHRVLFTRRAEIRDAATAFLRRLD